MWDSIKLVIGGIVLTLFSYSVFGILESVFKTKLLMFLTTLFLVLIFIYFGIIRPEQLKRKFLY